MNNHIQDVCHRFAAQGYVVVSPDLYYRTGVWQIFFGGIVSRDSQGSRRASGSMLEAANIEHAI